MIVYASLVNKLDGSDISSGVSVYTIKDGYTQNAGQGVLEYEGNGQWSYQPTEEELLDVTDLGILFHGTDVISQTVNVINNKLPLKNFIVYASLIHRVTGEDIEADILVQVIKDGNVQAAGEGTLEYEGNGQWSYRPTTYEVNNVRSLGILFYGNDSVPQTVTVCPEKTSTQPFTHPTYQTIEQLDEYFNSERLDSDLWFLLDEKKKSIYSLQATRIIDNLNYNCDKTDTDQALEFPRGTDTEIPKSILIAHAEICFALADGVNLEFEAEQLNENFIAFGGGKISVDSKEYHAAKIHGVPSIVAWRQLKKYFRPERTFSISRV